MRMENDCEACYPMADDPELSRVEGPLHWDVLVMKGWIWNYPEELGDVLEPV
jgi:hypothetical protein